MNENIRENIRQMIADANKDFKLSDDIVHMMTSICFIMYKTGLDNGFTICLETIKKAKENINK